MPFVHLEYHLLTFYCDTRSMSHDALMWNASMKKKKIPVTRQWMRNTSFGKKNRNFPWTGFFFLQHFPFSRAEWSGNVRNIFFYNVKYLGSFSSLGGVWMWTRAQKNTHHFQFPCCIERFRAIGISQPASVYWNSSRASLSIYNPFSYPALNSGYVQVLYTSQLKCFVCRHQCRAQLPLCHFLHDSQFYYSGAN